MQLSLAPALLLEIGVIAVLVFLVLGFFVAPRRYVRKLPDLGPPPEGDRISLKDQVTIRGDQEKRRNDLRTGALQAIGGLAVIFALLSTLLQLQANQKEATEQQALTRQGQIADRFTKAIEQLGNQNNLDVRLGGIYGLEQIARDSRDDRTRLATYEVLTAYVRDHAIWSPDAPPVSDGITTHAPDIQAVMTILARRDVSKGDPRLVLHGVNLQVVLLNGDAHLERADFELAHLEVAQLSGAHLEGAILKSAHLRGINLNGAHLEGANSGGAELWSAHFGDAHLEGVQLNSAHLEGANLSGAHLERANLNGAQMEGAHLDSANLERARLDHTDLKGTIATPDTTWPTGFNWKAAGVRLAS